MKKLLILCSLILCLFGTALTANARVWVPGHWGPHHKVWYPGHWRN